MQNDGFYATCPKQFVSVDAISHGYMTSDATKDVDSFLPECDYIYVTFRSLLSQFRLSVVCLSVMLVHPTRGVKAFGNISSPLCTLAII